MLDAFTNTLPFVQKPGDRSSNSWPRGLKLRHIIRAEANRTPTRDTEVAIVVQDSWRGERI